MAKAKKSAKTQVAKTTTKTASKKPAKKALKKAAGKASSQQAVVNNLASKAKHQAEMGAEAIDKMLLKLAPGPYAQILKQIETGKRRIDEERKLALQIGTRILEKAREVRDSLITRSRAKN